MCAPPCDDLRFSNTTGILQQQKTMWLIGVEVEQETNAPPPKKNPGSAPEDAHDLGKGAVAAPARFSHFLLLNDFPPPSRSLEQATLPSADKHSSTSSTKNVLKAFFDITF